MRTLKKKIQNKPEKLKIKYQKTNIKIRDVVAAEW